MTKAHSDEILLGREAQETSMMKTRRAKTAWTTMASIRSKAPLEKWTGHRPHYQKAQNSHKSLLATHAPSRSPMMVTCMVGEHSATTTACSDSPKRGMKSGVRCKFRTSRTWSLSRAAPTLRLRSRIPARHYHGVLARATSSGTGKSLLIITSSEASLIIPNNFRIVQRNQQSTLIPRAFGLPTGPKKGITSIHAGSDHAFAISKTGDVWAWGSNNYGMTGISERVGTDNATITNPRIVKALHGKEVVDLAAGRHHSIACTKSGECLAWGRVDSHQLGIEKAHLEKLPDNDIMRSEIGKLRVVLVPQKVDIDGDVVMVAAASDHSFAVTEAGKAYSWGFNENYQTGHGDEDDDIAEATMLDNSAVRGKRLVGAGCGGQFSVLLGV